MFEYTHNILPLTSLFIYFINRAKKSTNEFVSSITDRRNMNNCSTSDNSFVHRRTRKDPSDKDIIVINDNSSELSITIKQLSTRKQIKYIISNELHVIDTVIDCNIHS